MVRPPINRLRGGIESVEAKACGENEGRLPWLNTEPRMAPEIWEG